MADGRAGRVDAGHPSARAHGGGQQAGLVAAVAADVQDLIPRPGAAERHEAGVDPAAPAQEGDLAVSSYMRMPSIVSPRELDRAFMMWSSMAYPLT